MKREKTLRHPVVSGLFYPDEKDDLENMVEGYLRKVDVAALGKSIAEAGVDDPGQRPPVAVIAPHAGYIFSGAVQAHAYALLRGFKFDTAVIIGTAHQAAFPGISVNLDSAYRTPLGEVEVDLDISTMLVDSDGRIDFYQEAHLGEHAVEVQLPFIQVAMPGTRIIPLLFGEQTLDGAILLKKALLRIGKKTGGKIIYIVSTDLSHYHSRIEATALDGRFREELRRMDTESLLTCIQAGECEACGFAGVLTAMLIAGETGLGKSAVLDYRDSGEVSGDRRRVVGYLAAALY